jgi:hypothetical protein
MTDYRLRFNTEIECGTSLSDAGISAPNADYLIDVIGQIFAEVDDDGIIIVPGDNRWHVNLRCLKELTTRQYDEIEPFIVYPTNPVRSWA